MASRIMVAVLVIIGMVPMFASGKDIVVGDGAGWTLGFDYQSWAQTKDFRVGDRLIFKYTVGYHNVIKVNGTGFQSCTVPSPSNALATGNDTIVLASTGNKWYICGVGKHCENGMKLVISVKPPARYTIRAPTPSPAPGPTPALGDGKEIVVGDGAGWTLGFDYQAWAKTKDFRVGDKIVFKYPVGYHNVFKVNGTGFQSCNIPPANEAMVSGNDEIVLATPGNKWYICGVGKHCQNGMRLAITVKPANVKARRSRFWFL